MVYLATNLLIILLQNGKISVAMPYGLDKDTPTAI